MIVGSLGRRPLILVGQAWRLVLDAFYSQLGDYTPSGQRELLQFVATPSAAVEMLERMST
jgi:hypothetical protein